MKKVRHLPTHVQALYCSWYGFKLSDNVKKVNRFFKRLKKENKDYKEVYYMLDLEF